MQYTTRVERATARQVHGMLTEEHKQTFIYRKIIDQVERSMLKAALEFCGGNKSKVSRELNISLSSLRIKLDRHGLME